MSNESQQKTEANVLGALRFATIERTDPENTVRSLGYGIDYRVPELRFGLTVIFHGQSRANDEGVFHGQKELVIRSELTHFGSHEVRQAGELFLKIRGQELMADQGRFVFLSSPLNRAQQADGLYLLQPAWPPGIPLPKLLNYRPASKRDRFWNMGWKNGL